MKKYQMEELIKKLNDNYCCNFKKDNVNEYGYEESYECDTTGAYLVKDFGQYQLDYGYGLIRFTKFDFKEGKFLAFQSGLCVHQVYDHCMDAWLKGNN